MKLRALIVDDELHARENMRYLLRDHCPEIEVVGMAGETGETCRLIGELAPEVLFLDICMPSGTEGFEMLGSIPKKNFQVVFVTAFKDYAIRALNANAIHYLQKPVDVDELRNAVDQVTANHALFRENSEHQSAYNRALENLAKTPSLSAPNITVNDPAGYAVIEQKNLMYMSGQGETTSIVFTDGSSRTDSKPIGAYETILEPGTFYRIHRSHIVNLNCVKELREENGHFVVMKNNERLPLSRMRLRQFVRLFSENKRSGIS